MSDESGYVGGENEKTRDEHGPATIHARVRLGSASRQQEAEALRDHGVAGIHSVAPEVVRIARRKGREAAVAAQPGDGEPALPPILVHAAGRAQDRTQ